MEKFKTALAAVAKSQPSQPVYTYRPHAIERAANFFLSNFKGRVLAAVKTNPSPTVLKKLGESGIRHFDVASINEIRAVRSLFPAADLYFMHTVKSREAIREAFFEHRVRHFSFDSHSELSKICQETGLEKDNSDPKLGLHLRIAVSNGYSDLSLSEKFGAEREEAIELLKKARPLSRHLGVSFHVGSQCMSPEAYRAAIGRAFDVIEASGVKVDSLDVGGGFPSIYPGRIPPVLSAFFDAIHTEFQKVRDALGVPELWCEPGRALVAESGGLLVRVELRKGSHLYINEGTYGSLFDAGSLNWVFPVRRVGSKLGGNSGDVSLSGLVPFSFYGPTCDSLDYMKGPFYLPQDMEEGDYIEIGQLGAYGQALSTSFNGFGLAETSAIVLQDEPLMSMYDTKQPELLVGDWEAWPTLVGDTPQSVNSSLALN